MARVPLPEFIPPQLATVPDEGPAGDAWFHEIKLDGYRTAARLQTGKVRMLTRSGLDWTARFRPIAAALALPKIRAAYLDGEIAVLGEDGVTSFAAPQDALSRGQAQRLTYHVFDLLHLDGGDLTGLPLIERKALLEPLLARLPKGGPVRYSSHVRIPQSAPTFPKFRELPPNDFRGRDAKCSAKGTVREPDCQIGLEHEEAFADRLHELQWVNISHDDGSCGSPDDGAHPRQQEADLARGLISR